MKRSIFKNNSENPSFSSTLLDEIYRTIDENAGNINNIVEDEEMGSLRRACLIKKWTDKKVEEKDFNFEKYQLQVQDINDPLFFSSTSNSSVSSSGVLSSSSDTEYFEAVEKTRNSCFVSSWPKPIKTKVSASSQKEETEDFSKSKLEAWKVYGNLKNLKQSISPGARLTNFINSFLTNGSSKKNNKKSKSGLKMEGKSKSTQSSATSFSRSLLSKTPPFLKGELHQVIAQRRVSFNPVSVIVDEEYRPCGHKCIDEKGSKSDAMLLKEMNLKKREDLKVYQNTKDGDLMAERETSIGEDDEDEEEGSDCSSDLFEIDHLVLFGNKRFCDELPVYETTDLGKNLAIARGFKKEFLKQ